MVKKSTQTTRAAVCPWWLLPTFDNPLRRLIQNPQRILEGLVQVGQRAADLGCGMGYFSLPMARLAGETGRVYAVDLQPEMLAGLEQILLWLFGWRMRHPTRQPFCARRMATSNQADDSCWLNH